MTPRLRKTFFLRHSVSCDSDVVCHLIHYCFHSVFHTEHHSHIPLSGPVIPGLHMGRPPMVEKAVQTLNLEAFRQGRSLNVFQEDQQQQQQQWPRRNLPRSRAEVSNPRRIAESVGNDVFTEECWTETRVWSSPPPTLSLSLSFSEAASRCTRRTAGNSEAVQRKQAAAQKKTRCWNRTSSRCQV